MTLPDIAACADWLQEHLGAFVFTVDHPALPRCAGAHRPGQPCDGTRGKHPCGRWTRDATADAAVIRAALTRGLRNLGIDCGTSGLLVIDEDTPGAFSRYARAVDEVLPVTFTVTTGKGSHIYFRQPPGHPSATALAACPAVADVRGRGGYVVGPGSMHHTGVAYTPVEPSTRAAPAPGWLITALRSPSPARPRPGAGRPGSSPHGRLLGAVGFVLAAVPGERNNRLHWAACRAAEMIAARQLDQGTAIDALTEVGEAVGPGEVQATIASALRNAAM